MHFMVSSKTNTSRHLFGVFLAITHLAEKFEQNKFVHKGDDDRKKHDISRTHTRIVAHRHTPSQLRAISQCRSHTFTFNKYAANSSEFDGRL